MTSPPLLALAAASITSDGIEGWATWPTLSAGGLLGLFVVSILRGWLQPKANLDRQERETVYWREAHKASEAARVLQSEQLRDLLDGSRTVLDVLRSMQAAAPRPRQRDTR